MTDFNAHIISALWHSFVKANLVTKLDFCSTLLLITSVDGPLSSDVEASTTSFFSKKNPSLRDSSHFSVGYSDASFLVHGFSEMVLPYWIKKMFFLQNLHLAFVLSECSSNNQSLYSSLFIQSRLNLAALCSSSLG